MRVGIKANQANMISPNGPGSDSLNIPLRTMSFKCCSNASFISLISCGDLSPSSPPISTPFIFSVEFANGLVSYYVAFGAGPPLACICHLKETA